MASYLTNYAGMFCGPRIKTCIYHLTASGNIYPPRMYKRFRSLNNKNGNTSSTMFAKLNRLNGIHSWQKYQQSFARSLGKTKSDDTTTDPLIYFNPSPPGQNDRHFADDILKCIFVNETFFIRISIRFDNKLARVQVITWCRTGHIIWTNADPVQQRINAALGEDGSNNVVNKYVQMHYWQIISYEIGHSLIIIGRGVIIIGGCDYDCIMM